ncbi:MAG: hypothetical protein OWU84_08240 [Firmicutes bacterium]|nr:hypothetical protein [Bacillota bacterium]
MAHAHAHCERRCPPHHNLGHDHESISHRGTLTFGPAPLPFTVDDASARVWPKPQRQQGTWRLEWDMALTGYWVQRPRPGGSRLLARRTLNQILALVCFAHRWGADPFQARSTLNWYDVTQNFPPIEVILRCHIVPSSLTTARPRRAHRCLAICLHRHRHLQPRRHLRLASQFKPSGRPK